jgi:hypothetical protein
MRLTAVHDGQGNIAVLVVSPPDSPPPAQLDTQPGQRMTEVEAPSEVTLDLDSPRLREDLDNLRQSFRVEIPSDEGRLTRKSEG